MATNTVTTSWKKNGIFESDNPSKHSLIMYDASDDNGDLVGFGPKALMLSSLAGCSGLEESISAFGPNPTKSPLSSDA